MPSPDISLYSVEAVLILDNDGKRLFAKYYQPPYADSNAAVTDNKLATSVKDQTAFEKGLFAKTNKQNADVILYDSKVIVYKQIVDISLYIVGGMEENEAMLYQVVLGLRDALDILLKHSADKRTVLENYDLVSLAVDETIDSGIILEVDPVIIASRVSKAPTNEPSINNIDLSEQGLLNVYQFARGKLSEKLRQQFQ
ncbi:Ret3p [Sugiyamaella lignohabitans]|uniref:Coatomer subunit zeta n=1 Tax=Sugiyamaella lignohabitans TaxID=796027 RepID=A0A167F0N9_9ASCO|nr:Ret3p [Sugiyamaella lignohabitans]ANB14678.1 Ret3p [Sugiyamaella lignohabitans]